MRRDELHYRKTQQPSFSSENRNRLPQPRGSAGGDIEQRIVTLYRSGQSIEAITREVGRARHLVVHVLHSTGVFGTVPQEPSLETAEALDAMAQDLSPPPQQDESSTIPTRNAEEAPVMPSPRVKRIRRSKPPEGATAQAAAPVPTATPSAAPVKGTSKWSPQIVDALFKVVTQGDDNPGMSVEEVRELVSKPKRSRASRM